MRALFTSPEKLSAQFPCQLPNRFRRKGDLKAHVQFKHDDFVLAEQISRSRSTKAGKQFPCPFPGCCSGYARRGDLARHLRKKHATDGGRQSSNSDDNEKSESESQPTVQATAVPASATSAEALGLPIAHQ